MIYVRCERMSLGRALLLPALVLAAMLVLAVPSCATMSQVSPTAISATYDEAAALVDAAKQEIARLEAKIDLTPDEAGQLAKSKAWVANIETLIADIRSNADAQGREPDVGDVITDAAPFFGPYGMFASVLLGAGSEWWRGRKKRKSFDTLRGLVNAFNRVKAKDGEFANALDKAGPALRAEMGTTVRNDVDVIRNGAA